MILSTGKPEVQITGVFLWFWFVHSMVVSGSPNRWKVGARGPKNIQKGNLTVRSFEPLGGWAVFYIEWRKGCNCLAVFVTLYHLHSIQVLVWDAHFDFWEGQHIWVELYCIPGEITWKEGHRPA